MYKSFQNGLQPQLFFQAYCFNSIIATIASAASAFVYYFLQCEGLRGMPRTISVALV